jgi:C4-dicarboxylate-specific signal transduction histidine kinase
MNPNKRLRLAREKFQAGLDALKAARYQQAADYSLEAAELWKRLKGKEQNYAACLGNAASALVAIGRYAKATSLFEEAISLQKQVLGAEHPDVANSLNTLAVICRAQGDYEKAKQLHEKALAVREKTLGSEHADVADSLNNLASIYQAQGDTEKAQQYLQRAQAIINKVFDENHPTAQIISRNYLKLQQELENLKRREVKHRITLEEAKKLSYLGNMATGVAHNINNPVGIIRLAAQRGLRRLEKGMSVAEGEEIFQRILKQADRLYTIIQNFREFANGDRQRREVVELNALVEQIKDHFDSQLEAHHIRLTLELSNENPGSQANHFVLQAVLINLISNAREALENIPDAFILIKTWQTAKKVGLQVEDNGAGVPQAQQQNLFSPFHSTKAHGTGLGLHFAHKALADIGGIITYQDRQPNGACFMIELPPTNGAKI